MSSKKESRQSDKGINKDLSHQQGGITPEPVAQIINKTRNNSDQENGDSGEEEEEFFSNEEGEIFGEDSIHPPEYENDR